MSRQHKWQNRENPAVVVDRKSKFGNRFKVGEKATMLLEGGPLEVMVKDREHAVTLFRSALDEMLAGRRSWYPVMDDYPVHDIAELRGSDVACWCGLAQFCHGDVLLEIANP